MEKFLTIDQAIVDFYNWLEKNGHIKEAKQEIFEAYLKEKRLM